MEEILPLLYSDNPMLFALGFICVSVGIFVLCTCWALIISYVLTDLGINIVSEIQNTYLRILIIFISGPVGWLIAFWIVVIKPAINFFRR